MTYSDIFNYTYCRKIIIAVTLFGKGNMSVPGTRHEEKKNRISEYINKAIFFREFIGIISTVVVEEEKDHYKGTIDNAVTITAI